MTHCGNATITHYNHLENLGSVEVYCCGYEENGKSYSAYWPNIALFCPQCGKVWGMMMYKHHFNYSPIPEGKYKVETVVCRNCGGAALFS
jgi:hypothetical protein